MGLESWFGSFQCRWNEEIGGSSASLVCPPASCRNESPPEAGSFIQSLRSLSRFSCVISAVDRKNNQCTRILSLHLGGAVC